MTRFNPAFWEIPTDIASLDRVSASAGLWYETEVDKQRRSAFQDFFRTVSPEVHSLIDAKLTGRQREVVKLYYYYGKTQEDIAIILNLTQSTVSRHLFGTARGGKKVGGAIPKLRKAIDSTKSPKINAALNSLQDTLARAV